MVAFTKDVVPQTQGAFYSDDSLVLDRCVCELRLAVKNIGKDSRRAELDGRMKRALREDFIKMFCGADVFSQKERKEMVASDGYYYSFITGPLLITPTYHNTIYAFTQAASAPHRDDLLDAALTYLAQVLKEVSDQQCLPVKPEGIDGVALRMIAVEILHCEAVKKRSDALLVEAMSMVLESFLRVRDCSAVKIT